MIARLFAVLVVVMLAGCTEKRDLHWYDASGRRRSEDLAMVDRQICEKSFPLPRQPMPADRRQRAVELFVDCMTKRGWEIR